MIFTEDRDGKASEGMHGSLFAVRRSRFAIRGYWFVVRQANGSCEWRTTNSVKPSSIGMLPIDRPDVGAVFLERIEMHHPIEDDGMKLATVGVTFLFRDD